MLLLQLYFIEKRKENILNDTATKQKGNAPPCNIYIHCYTTTTYVLFLPIRKNNIENH